MARSKWLNTEKIVAPDTEKPCHELGWCPYGQLVEEFPFSVNTDSSDPYKYKCRIFGHDCPAFYHREDVCEGVGK